MQTKNSEKVSNGDLGFITGITTNSKGERLVQMDFGGDRKLTYTTEQLAHVDLAYATTIHKAMGSEFETVIIPIVKAHTIMLYRNLLYTAVTSAKKKVILVGHKPILFMAVHRADISKRNTMPVSYTHLDVYKRQEYSRGKSLSCPAPQRLSAWRRSRFWPAAALHRQCPGG